ncbi:PAS domain-containing protein [Variovorax sp. JS1663]|uniref:PAS domain-containing protein n=1 Tax=Variovorax sp. JS1663 TaxID=1851577 RepID=UPI000B344568|nr:PAS domain-containing protein [Variovorax sp. JS1663]OUM03937.1 hypothetical protein A8M77_02665 [Variovorax sp. JS1663]
MTASSRPSTPPSLRALHLEDDPHDAEIIQAVLEEAGLVLDIQRVDTRDGFCAGLAEGGFDLVLADFSLPTFDGLSALELAREHAPELPFIFVSGALGEEVAIEALKNGATDYVLKARLSRLASAVRRALRERQERVQRRHAEERLRRSEAFLADGQRISHTGSWGWALADGTVTWSDEQYRMLGFQPGGVAPSLECFLGVVHPDDLARVQRVLDEALRGRQPYSMDYRVVLPDGSARHLRSMGRPVQAASGQVEEFIGTTTDITERVEAEATLRARQEMLDLAQQAARAVAFECRIGPGMAPGRSAHGQAPDGAYASIGVWRQRVHPDDWPAVEDAIRHAEQSGQLEVEYRAADPDAGARWLQAKGRMLRDEEGRPERIVGFMFDVTQRRDAEHELRRLQARLLQAQRLEALGTLAGGIAHDFNNILGAVLGYGERMLRELPREGRLRRDIENILAAGERGRALVDRILTFSRSGMGECIPVHVEGVVRETLDLLAATLPAGISIRSTLKAGRAAIQGDPTQVHQLLMNLATNAIQAMPAGGTLDVSLALLHAGGERAVTVGTVAAGDYVVLEVRDSGIGIAPEKQDRIFDPFFTTKELGVGTGLGLSLVHGIVTGVGGAIDVTSMPGQGSCFSVYLPRASDAPEQAHDAEQDIPRGTGQRVLFVDDEALLVELATETLAELGYAMVGFTSSAEALEAFRADPEGFDALVTDERMPGMSGSALIRQVRSIRRGMPVLLVSGYVGDVAVPRGGDAGPDELLKKPLSTRQLAISLARVLTPPLQA